MKDKPPYKLVISLETYLPGSMAQVLAVLGGLLNEYDLVGEHKTKIVVESTDEVSLLTARGLLETYLREHKIGVDGKINLESPVVRPEPNAPKKDKPKTEQASYLRLVNDTEQEEKLEEDDDSELWEKTGEG